MILLLDPTLLRDGGSWKPAAPVREPAGASLDDADRRPTVMLVDDSVSIRKFVGQMLEKAGFRVVTAIDGQDALEQLVERTVDVVVTDLEMPRLNGYALIEDLRRRPATREVPVIVMTTRAGEKHAGLARRLGVRHYITKPVDEQSFVRIVESVAAGERALEVGRRPRAAGSLVE